MGKQVQVKSGYSSVLLPDGDVHDAGEVADLTDSEYASLDAATAAAITLLGTVVDPDRSSLHSAEEANVAMINQQAFVGGTYQITNYVSHKDSTTVVRVPVAKTVGGSVDVQSLAAGGYNFTGKGGIYRLSLWLDCWIVEGVIPAGEAVTLTVTMKKPGGANLVVWQYQVAVGTRSLPTADKRRPDVWTPIADDWGPMEFQTRASRSAGIAAWDVQLLAEVDIHRLAGWPVP